MDSHSERKAWKGPSAQTMRVAKATLEPWRRYTKPHFEGLERVPAERPLLFVGNHTLYGVLDIPLLFFELYERHGIFLRGLGDHTHFKIPVWRRFLNYFGTVDGTPDNFAALMRESQSVLVFPGGGREVAKRKNEQYKLVWKERAGFARLALAHGCTVVPFAAIGVEDAFDIVWDAEDLMKTPLGWLVKRFGVRQDILWPIAKGIGPTPIPRRERYYFQVCEPLRPDDIAPHAPPEERVKLLRERTKQAVERGIETLLALRATHAQNPENRNAQKDPNEL